MAGSMAGPMAGPIGPMAAMAPPYAFGAPFGAPMASSGLPMGSAQPASLPEGRMPGTAMPPGPPLPYRDVVRHLSERLDLAAARNQELTLSLDHLTHGKYSADVQRTFSLTRKENIDEVDWRVPRLMFCKDPKNNKSLGSLPPALAVQVQERKIMQAQGLEQDLGLEAVRSWAGALASVGMQPPPLETVAKQSVAFKEAQPNYAKEEDVWSRRLELRTLDEAMRGDLTKPLPAPVVFESDHSNFLEGKYVKDDCYIT